MQTLRIATSNGNPIPSIPYNSLRAKLSSDSGHVVLPLALPFTTASLFGNPIHCSIRFRIIIVNYLALHFSLLHRSTAPTHCCRYKKQPYNLIVLYYRRCHTLDNHIYHTCYCLPHPPTSTLPQHWIAKSVITRYVVFRLLYAIVRNSANAVPSLPASLHLSALATISATSLNLHHQHCQKYINTSTFTFIDHPFTILQTTDARDFAFLSLLPLVFL